MKFNLDIDSVMFVKLCVLRSESYVQSTLYKL